MDAAARPITKLNIFLLDILTSYICAIFKIIYPILNCVSVRFVGLSVLPVPSPHRVRPTPMSPPFTPPNPESDLMPAEPPIAAAERPNPANQSTSEMHGDQALLALA